MQIEMSKKELLGHRIFQKWSRVLISLNSLTMTPLWLKFILSIYSFTLKGTGSSGIFWDHWISIQTFQSPGTTLWISLTPFRLKSLHLGDIWHPQWELRSLLRYYEALLLSFTHSNPPTLHSKWFKELYVTLFKKYVWFTKLDPFWHHKQAII